MSSDPRIQAVRNLQQVLKGRSLDVVLARPTSLSEQDRALAAELSFGVCRWYRRLDALIGQLLNKPLRNKEQDIQLLLMLGAYQLLYSRVPAHAAVSATVEAVRGLGKKWAVKLVNGVLRRLQRERESLSARVDQVPEQRWAQPDWFVDAMRTAWPQHWRDILQSLQQRPPMTLRVNLAMITREDYAAKLLQAGFAAAAVANVPSALVLDKAAPVTRLPGFDQGLVSVQDAAAQLAALLLDIQPGQKILDACAAPGGKTMHLLEQAADLQLVAVDVDEQRLGRVHENLQRGGMQATVCQGDAALPQGSAWGAQRYDRILLDAPCSATGVMRRHPDIRLLRRVDDIAGLVGRQAAMVDSLWQRLAPGGKLLYVTCSVMPQENYQQIERFMARQPEARLIELPDHWGSACVCGRQILPGEDGMDGFYYALLEKPTA